MTVHARDYSNGMTCLWTGNAAASEFTAAIARHCDAGQHGFALVFYSPHLLNGAQLCEHLQTAAPDLTVAGCSTAGELTPDGLDDHSAVAILFPANRFSVSTCVLEDITTRGMDDIAAQASHMREQLLARPGASVEQAFAISLIDGLTYAEESVTSSIYRGLIDIPLIGGSAGDDLTFSGTRQICNGQEHTGSAVLILVQSSLPFKTFTSRNFVPTDARFVVTESSPEHRNVREFNAEPAARAYASALNLDISELTPAVFASNPVVVRVGGEYYCRSIQKVEADESLTFFCAIDDGIVLTLAKSIGMAAATNTTLSQIHSAIGEPPVVLGFDCIYRRLDASNRGVNQNISLLYSENNVIGFATYGEQFNSMHVNQTFTGIAFGREPDGAQQHAR